MNILLNVITTYVATQLGVFSFHEQEYLQVWGEAWVKDKMSLNCEFEYKSNKYILQLFHIYIYIYIYIYTYICTYMYITCIFTKLLLLVLILSQFKQFSINLLTSLWHKLNNFFFKTLFFLLGSWISNHWVSLYFILSQYLQCFPYCVILMKWAFYFLIRSWFRL